MQKTLSDMAIQIRRRRCLILRTYINLPTEQNNLQFPQELKQIIWRLYDNEEKDTWLLRVEHLHNGILTMASLATNC